MKCKVWIAEGYGSTAQQTCVEFEWADLAIADAFIRWFNANNTVKRAFMEAE
jgi:hypothetical protein